MTLSAALVGTENSKTVPIASGTPALVLANGGDGGETPPVMVQVIAPATLPEGYTFQAAIGGNAARTFNVEVPRGGVTEGSIFLAPVPPDMNLGPCINAPTGRWKDGLCGCCNYGPCHAHFCCALCCTQIAMGQVMQRMRLTWCGLRGPEERTRDTFKVVVALVVCYTVYSIALEIWEMPSDGYDLDIDPQQVPDIPIYIPILRLVGSLLFTIWSVYALCKTRENVRSKYSIPESCCTGCEDCCCAFWCTCCVVGQIARHTGEYETYAGTCCTETGLPATAPPVV